jgi:response regulator RpfG family c-di-GMP phosphodiesterase
MGKILFVDDEQSILDVTNEYFVMRGYEVVTARSGEEALEILTREDIDCCFTDINMPVMDGIELTERIREIDNTIPVIVITGYPSIDYTINTLRRGVVDFLIKPINLSQLELCFQRVLRERQLFAENLLLKKEVEGKQQLEKLNRELVYKVDELNKLNKILSIFKTLKKSSDVFERVVDLVVEIVPADEAWFYVSNDSVQVPFPVAAARAGGSSVVSEVNAGQGRRLVSDRCLLGLTNEASPLLMPENSGGNGLSTEVRSFMASPLIIRGKVFGIITVFVLNGSRRLTDKDLFYTSYLADNAAHAIENLALYENIYQNLFATLYAFVTALGARDRYTQQHSNRVTGISVAIGHEMKCTPEEIDILQFAGHLHDIGKIGIRDDILLRSGSLTPEEYEEIKTHPDIGANILGQLGLWEREKEIIRCHHERFDGSGYPRGLKGDQIPFLARILSLADVLDAMSSGRTYRERIPPSRCLEIISGEAGTQFDPEVVTAFIKLYREGKLTPYLERG